MTDPLDRLATTLTTAPPAAEPALLLGGTVISLGPPIRVDSGSMRLSAATLVAVNVGDSVNVLRSGATVLILGVGRSIGAPVGAKIRRSTNQTFTTQAQLVCDTVVGTDPYGFFNAAGYLVVPAGLAGLYLLSAHWRWDGTGASNNPVMAIMVNGTPVVRDAPGGTPPAFFEQHAAVPFALAAGDIVRVDGVNSVSRAVAAVAAAGTDPLGPILEAWRIG